MENYFEKGPVLIISDLLSLITISSCVVIKIPQIRTINALESAEGISVFGLCLELFSYSIMTSYNYSNDYALLSYMEYPVLLLQEYVLVYLVFKYNNLLGQKSIIAAIIYVIFLTMVYFRVLPSLMLAIFVPLCTPIGATSKLLQLLAILRTKNSSSVSLMTWSLSAFTNFTRIYTVYVESKDLMLLSNFIISFSLSSSVFLAAFYYKKPKKV